MIDLKVFIIGLGCECAQISLYNDDQIQEKGVQMIIDAFLKDSPHYETIIEDKAFRRISPQF